MNQDVEFDIWYDALCHELKLRGYDHQPDRGTAHGDYDIGMTHERSADLFIMEWTIEQ